ncbi:hypothetical protein GIB67_028155 [Kingdonia uniflora]|uniref:Transmembrane protein n=1 Tax=Kingdonia uniflora TaxID=39325 RepID=A0A7J7KZP4_9MAGN|nr:hypothetical protein GIB67_028155 [Kingdonia uniflora]
MRKRVLMVCIIVGFLGLSVVALGFAAEAKKTKEMGIDNFAKIIVGLPCFCSPVESVEKINASCCVNDHVVVWLLISKLMAVLNDFLVASEVQFTAPSVCSYPRTPALHLGLAASIVLVMAQVIIIFEAGCICCKRNSHLSNSSCSASLICFVYWFTFVMAFLLLLFTGAALNERHEKEKIYFANHCYVVKPGVFTGGSLLSLASVTLGIVYYLTVSSAKDRFTSAGPNQGGIAMGQPQFPPQSTQQEPVFVHEDTYLRRQNP